MAETEWPVETAEDRLADDDGAWFWADVALFEYLPMIQPTGFVTYCALRRYAGGREVAWPGIRRLGLELGFARNTIRAALQRLVDADLLRIEPRQRPNGSRASHLYRMPRIKISPGWVNYRPRGVGQPLTPGVGQMLVPPEEKHHSEERQQEEERAPRARRKKIAPPPDLDAGCPLDVVAWAKAELGWDDRTIAYWHAEFVDAVRAGKVALGRDPVASLRNSFRRQVGKPVPRRPTASAAPGTGSLAQRILSGRG